jgi:hypothetical protein
MAEAGSQDTTSVPAGRDHRGFRVHKNERTTYCRNGASRALPASPLNIVCPTWRAAYERRLRNGIVLRRG